LKILGLDPGFGITGWGFVSFHGSSLNQPTLHSYGAMTTPTGQPLSWRLADLQNQFVALLDRLQPDRVAMERLFFGKNITTAEGVYQARGVLLAAMGQKSIVPIELTPNQIKQSITGSGKARKPEMMRMVQMLLNIDEPIRPDDAADALGCAIAASAYSNLEYQQLQHPEGIQPDLEEEAEIEWESESDADRISWPGPSVPLESQQVDSRIARMRRTLDPVTGQPLDSTSALDVESFTREIRLGSEIRILPADQDKARKSGKVKGSSSASSGRKSSSSAKKKTSGSAKKARVKYKK
tara:strand:- start:31481 stop:32368 length:888 start_codon:yes stop_codon:yes gene_type:complete